MTQQTAPMERALRGGAGASAVRVVSLDGVRAYGIIFVFLTHLDAALVPGGWWGVEMFFDLSAFLITGILLREFERGRRIDFRGFYLRRALRLLPALYIWAPVAVLTAYLQGEEQFAKVPWSLAGSLFYFGNFQQAWTSHVAAAFDQTWSLAVEEQFYFIWPLSLLLILKFLGPRAQRVTLTALVLVGFAATTWGSHNWFLPSMHLLPLALGCWGAEQMARGMWRWLERLVRLPGIPLLCLTICTVIAFAHPTTAMLTVNAVSSFVLILNLCLEPDTRASRFLSIKPLVWTGQRAYGIYLFGLTGMQLVAAGSGLPLRAVAPIAIAGTLVVVGVLYRYVEYPAQVRGWAWYKRRHVPTIQHAGPGGAL